MESAVESLRRKPGLLLLAAALAAAAGAAWRDSSSEIAALLRAKTPVAGLIWTRHAGQGRVVPPALYVALYLPEKDRLEIIALHATSPTASPEARSTLGDVYSRAYYALSGDVRGASRAMAEEGLRLLSQSPSWPPGAPAPAFRLELALPDDDADLAAVKDRLAAWYAGPAFWLRLPGRLTDLERTAPGLSCYDALLLAWTLARLDPRRIGLSLLPAPKLIPSFLAAALGNAPPPASGPVTAEILNSSGSSGLAMKATKVLRSQGIDVLHFGNARAREPLTRVLDRVGVPAGGKAVLEALGCPPSEVLTEMEGDPKAAVTVVLGQDYKSCSRLGD